MKYGDNAVAVAAQVIASESGIEIGMPFEDRIRTAMINGKDCWMITDEDERFRASVVAVLLNSSEEEIERITQELYSLRDLSALLSNVPIDIDRMTKPSNPIGLMKIWREVNGK